MSRGGARNRSGPAKDPTSRTSERQGYTLTALPAAGYAEQPPPFPLSRIQRFLIIEKMKIPDSKGTNAFRRREMAVWRDHWKTPQACAWSMQPWRWETIAEFCRLKTVVELEPDANASLVSQLHRYRDQIGLTPAGLRENGWAITTNELAEKAAEKSQQETAAPKRERRLRSVGAE